MTATKIAAFVTELAKQENSPRLFNPYRQPHLAQNLVAYLEYMHTHFDSGLLLVGEAPGYRGCRLTGIPFTSGAIIRARQHPIFEELADRLTLTYPEKEATATIIWSFLAQRPHLPLFWNAFPFHPHPLNQESRNRPPTAVEIREGSRYLRRLAIIFQPTRLAAIGRKGEIALRLAFPGNPIGYIRHPAHGGKGQFLDGMENLFRSLDSRTGS